MNTIPLRIYQGQFRSIIIVRTDFDRLVLRYSLIITFCALILTALYRYRDGTLMRIKPLLALYRLISGPLLLHDTIKRQHVPAV